MSKMILKESLFLSSVLTFCFSVSVYAETIQSDNKTSQIQSLKPELAKANVSFKVLKSGETLAAAEIPKAESEEESSDVEFYFAAKDSSKWTFLDSLQLEGSSFEFRDDGVIKISIEEGGSSSSTTTSLWRLEKDRLKVIGQDSEMLDRSALNRKTDPTRVTESTNFLTGRMVVKSEFAHAKTKKIECKFDKKEFDAQKVSEMSLGGVKVPECPSTKK
ncbi:hypothetical protein [Bdellovibrio sp. HCB337]|uniref:hypothetical protein n=1 Tax=Bdellovibrio sp. HCB337 TaxID=3394358 RepID=UPI0039A7392D